MALKKESIFYDILSIYDPWVISVVSYSKHLLRIEFTIDYASVLLTCPVCSRRAHIIDKIPFSWQFLDLFDFNTHMTAFLPVVSKHNFSCKAQYNQEILRNTLLLDLMVMQLQNTRTLNPLKKLFEVLDLTRPQRITGEPNECKTTYFGQRF